MNKTFGIIIRSVIALGLVCLLLTTVDVRELFSTFEKGNFLYFIAACGLYSLGQLLSSFKWQYILKLLEYEVRILELVKLYFIGMYFNMFLPTSIGGDVVRYYSLANTIKSNRSALLSIFIERMTGLLALISINIVALIIVMNTHNFDHQIYYLFLISLFIVGLILLLILKCGESPLAFNVKNVLFVSFQEKANNVILAFSKFSHKKVGFLNILFISALFQTLVVFSIFLLARFVNITVDLRYLFVFIPVITVISMAPISINGIGVREWAFIYFFSLVSVESEQAVALSLGWFFMLLVCSLPGKLIYLNKGVIKEKNNE